MKYTVIVAVLLAFVAGCSSNDSDDVKGQADKARDNVKVTTDHVWSAQVKSLDKAKHVSQNLMDAAKKQRQAIDQESE